MTAIIIDDERQSAESLFLLLQKYCPGIDVVSICTNSTDAYSKIEMLNPQLLFLDVELQNTNAFEFVTKLDLIPLIIITTAYDQYALKAIKIDVVDYLLKPIEKEELIISIEKAKNKLPSEINSVIRANPKIYLERISMPTSDGILFLPVSSIIRFEADGSYTHMYLIDKNKVTLTKNMSGIEKMLTYTSLFRVHKSHIVNLSHIIKYYKNDGSELILSNGDSIPVARDRKEDFFEAMRIFNQIK